MNKETTIVCVVRHFEANAATVFDAFLDPAIAGQWMFATPAGKIVRAEIDARVGGAFCFTDRRDGEDIEHIGNYLEIERPKRLAFDFLVPKYTSDRTRVVIDIAANGHSACELTLTHQGVWKDFAEQTQNGWTKMLTGLATTLNHGK